MSVGDVDVSVRDVDVGVRDVDVSGEGCGCER